MDSDRDYIIEKEQLIQTLNIIDCEILNYIARRKQVTEYIIEARKNYIEEYKNDEDKIIEYFDHENYIKEESFKTIDKRLREITILKESPYFGKITFNKETGIEILYIGRFGLTNESTYEPIVVDWRAPIASLFYKGILGKTDYMTPEGKEEANLLERKQLIIKKRELKGVFDSAIDIKDEILKMILTSNSSKKLKDIVNTIQQEQDEIIRAPKNKVVVVNGVAGSGKTTIALHRVSYLLYNHRKEFENKVLILGPNSIFIDYISEVLPTLGEDNVIQTTFEELAISELGIKEKVVSFSEYIEEAMNGNEEALLDYKYKSSVDFSEDLDKEIEKMNKEYFKIQPVVFFNEIIVDYEEIKKLFNEYYSKMPLFRRSEKIKRILVSKIKDKRDEWVRKLNNEIREKINNMTKQELEIEKNNIDFNKKIRIREIVREVMNSRDLLDEWINHENIVVLYKTISKTEKLGYMDLSPILYLMIKLEGKKSKIHYKHVVIDEAQDYSMTQFKVLKEITGCSSYTIVGDSNQRLIYTSEEVAMTELNSVFGDTLEYKLNKSYRSTQEIMEYANRYLEENSIIPLVRQGEKVIEEETESYEDMIETLVSIIEDYEEDGLESIGIIVENKGELHKLSNMLKRRIKVITIDNEHMIYKGGKVLLPSYYAKGLEFDGVILIQEHKDRDVDLVKYIMCTRALHRLAVIKKAKNS